jgi:hypothetical protein
MMGLAAGQYNKEVRQMSSDVPYPSNEIHAVEQGKLDENWSYEILRTVETALTSRWSEGGEELFGFAVTYAGPDATKPEQTYYYKLHFPTLKQARKALDKQYKQLMKR